MYIPAENPPASGCGTEILEAGKEFGAVPCGLGARNTLGWKRSSRLYGHEISDHYMCGKAGLDRFCKMEEGGVVGRAALEQAKAAGLKRTWLELERVGAGNCPRWYKVSMRVFWGFLGGGVGAEMGYVTSGISSAVLKK